MIWVLVLFEMFPKKKLNEWGYFQVIIFFQRIGFSLIA